MRAPWLLPLVLVAACGKVSHRAADASPGAPDSGPDASLRGTVTVIALSPSGDGSPAAVVPVVFTDPDGTMVAEVTTDAQGVAQADVLPGATVTAVFASSGGGGTGALLGTVMAVNPGNHIQIGFKSNTPITSLGSMTINFPALAGATNYLVYNGCTSASTTGSSVSISFDSRCQRDTYDIMVVAEDGSSNPLKVATLNSAAFADGGTLTVPNNYQGGLGQMQFNFTNIPADITNISANRANLSQGRTLFGQAATITINQGAGTGSVTRLAGGDKALVTVAFQSTMLHELFERVAGNAASYNVNVSTDILPVLQQPTYNKNKSQIDWTAAATGSSADALIGIVNYQRTMPAAASFQWFIVGPGNLSAVSVPTLPDDLADNMPTTGDSLGMGVFLVETANIGTYDDDRDTIYPDIERIVNGGYDSDRIDWTGGYGTNITL